MRKAITISVLLLLVMLLFGCGRSKTVVTDIAGCTVVEEEATTTISCEDGTFAVIEDGLDGVGGLNGASSIIDVVNPCGNETTNDEVLLVFDTGEVVAWFKNVGLVVLDEYVSYRTTDGTNCRFQIQNSQVVEI